MNKKGLSEANIKAKFIQQFHLPKSKIQNYRLDLWLSKKDFKVSFMLNSASA